MSSEGTPLHGDRSAWNVVDFDTEHAKDISDSALQRHLPLPGAAGGLARSDGTDWQRVSSLALADLASYTRGYIIRGGAADWEAYDASTSGFILVGDGTDIASVCFDWDTMAGGASADMVHSHASAGEGGNIAVAAISDIATTYLKLDASNDPITAGLEINAATTGEPVLILQTTDDNATNPILEIQDSGGVMLSEIEKDGNLNFTTACAANPGMIEINDTRFFHTYGTRNLFAGLSAGNFTLTGTDCIGIGTDTLTALTSGVDNVCIGAGAGDSITSGRSNFCLGTGAGGSLIGGSYNLFIGAFVGQFVTTGSNNVGLGEGSLGSLIDGTLNVGIGSNTLANIVNEDSNIAIGALAMRDAVGADVKNNIAIGESTGLALTQDQNVFIGTLVARAATSARTNVAVGFQAADNLTTGDGNTLIGRRAGDVLTTGGSNIIIGLDADPTGAAVSNELNIGGLIYGALTGGMAGVNVTPPNLTAAWHIDQATDDAAIPVLLLDQADVSEEMIEFVSTIGVGNAIEAVDGKTLTTTHFIKVTLPGPLTVYLPVGTIA